MKTISTEDHKRLCELHKFIKENGIPTMTTKELCEYTELFALSLSGKGCQSTLNYV